jgi:hypothetical protein
MNVWIPLVLLSAGAGAFSAFAIRGRKAVLTAAVIPWCGLLAWLLYNEYFVPHQGGGASMWPIAQLVGGTVAAMAGACSSAAVRFARRSA